MSANFGCGGLRIRCATTTGEKLKFAGFWRRMMKPKRRLLAFRAFICAFAIGLLGLDISTLGTVSAQGPTGTYAIRNARIITVTGPVIENGTVVITDGKI